MRDPKQLLTINEVAQLFRVAPQRVKAWIRWGILPVVELPKTQLGTGKNKQVEQRVRASACLDIVEAHETFKVHGVVESESWETGSIWEQHNHKGKK